MKFSRIFQKKYSSHMKTMKYVGRNHLTAGNDTFQQICPFELWNNVLSNSNVMKYIKNWWNISSLILIHLLIFFWLYSLEYESIINQSWYCFVKSSLKILFSCKVIYFQHFIENLLGYKLDFSFTDSILWNHLNIGMITHNYEMSVKTRCSSCYEMNNNFFTILNRLFWWNIVLIILRKRLKY